MSKLSQVQKVINVFQENPNKRFTARRLAEICIKKYPEDYSDKRANPRFVDEKAFISQVAAEIGANKKSLTAKLPNLKWQDKPSPRVYWLERYSPCLDFNAPLPEEITETNSQLHSMDEQLTEADLYPILTAYLKSEHGLYCRRIDEKTSRNSYGAGGNQWLHPDLVAMEVVDGNWNEHVQRCVNQGGGQFVRLWSFEVKKLLSMGNVRSSFFQAVSNSSWANEGYLVATAIVDSQVELAFRT